MQKNTKTDDSGKLLEGLRTALDLRIKELANLVEEQNVAKTKTKKRYIQKKISSKKSTILKYISEIDRFNKKVEN